MKTRQHNSWKDNPRQERREASVIYYFGLGGQKDLSLRDLNGEKKQRRVRKHSM
jgi:hypothetical protein